MNNIRFIRSLLVLAVLSGSVWVVVIFDLVQLPGWLLVCDGAVTGGMLAGLCFLLRNILRYSQPSNMPRLQRMINYGALGVLFVLIWVGLGSYILYKLPSQVYLLLSNPTLPLRMLVAMLVYPLVVLIYERMDSKERDPLTAMETEADAVETVDEKEQTTMQGAEPSKPEVAEILEHIAVKNGQKIDVVLVGEVVAILAEGDYVMIYTTKGKFLKEQTMKHFADRLPKNKFVRVHRSSIVNIDFIQRIEAYEKQGQIVKLHNNVQAKMSAAGYKELKKVLLL